MKKRIKLATCPNCGKSLHEYDNFCPNCGQENDNKRQSFHHVFSHLVLDFLHLDSRVFQSLPALLFRPAFLTKQYLNGRRQRYLDPVKMFITLVVIYFILSAIGGNKPTPEKENPSYNFNSDSGNTENDSVIFKEGPFKIKVHNENEPVTLVASLGKLSDQVVLDVPNYERINSMVAKGKTATNEILDSLNIENTRWNRFYYGEVIKFAGADFEQFKSFLVSKLPWFIFFLMPVFALLLKLIYIRKNFLYIDHLIFAFHLHSFIFIIGILYVLISKLTRWDISIWLLLATLIYILFSFRDFYLQSWIKTSLKIFLLFILYGISSLFCFIISLLIIFLIY